MCSGRDELIVLRTSVGIYLNKSIAREQDLLVEMRAALLVCMLCSAPLAWGLTVPPLHAASPRLRTTSRSAHRFVGVRMQEGDELSDETLCSTAAAATGEDQTTTAWPEAKPTPVTPDDMSVGPSEGFDPRVILYVSLPALVLLGQLFFTFSRDTLDATALGPAVMDIYLQ